MALAQYADTAKADLADIFWYVAEHDATAAEALITLLTGTCDILADTPHAGRNRPDLAPSLRSFPKGNYVIFYTETSQGVIIVRVLHAARDIDGGLFEGS